MVERTVGDMVMTAEELRAWYEALTTEGKRVATQEAAEAIFHDERVGDEMDVVRVRGLVRERTERRLRAVAGVRVATDKFTRRERNND